MFKTIITMMGLLLIAQCSSLPNLKSANLPVFAQDYKQMNEEAKMLGNQFFFKAMSVRDHMAACGDDAECQDEQRMRWQDCVKILVRARRLVEDARSLLIHQCHQARHANMCAEELQLGEQVREGIIRSWQQAYLQDAFMQKSRSQ